MNVPSPRNFSSSVRMRGRTIPTESKDGSPVHQPRVEYRNICLAMQNQRFRVSARQKLEEAVFFFNQMVFYQNNVFAFPCFFSAFLSAHRSVTLYLQAQYNKNAAFSEWWDSQRKRLSDDSDMKWLLSQRNAVAHVAPIDLFYRQRFDTSDEIRERMAQSLEHEFTQIVKEDGEVAATFRAGSSDTAEAIPTSLNWNMTLDGGGRHVLTVCEHGLNVLVEIIADLENRRREMGLEPDPESRGDAKSNV